MKKVLWPLTTDQTCAPLALWRLICCVPTRGTSMRESCNTNAGSASKSSKVRTMWSAMWTATYKRHTIAALSASWNFIAQPLGTFISKKSMERGKLCSRWTYPRRPLNTGRGIASKLTPRSGTAESGDLCWIGSKHGPCLGSILTSVK